MKNRVVKVLAAQKNADDMAVRYGLQLFADDGDGGSSGDDGDSGGDDEGDESGNDDDNDSDNEKKYTDEEVDALIERKFAEWQKKHEKQQAKQDEAERLKNMSDQERKEHEMEDIR